MNADAVAGWDRGPRIEGEDPVPASRKAEMLEVETLRLDLMAHRLDRSTEPEFPFGITAEVVIACERLRRRLLAEPRATRNVRNGVGRRGRA